MAFIGFRPPCMCGLEYPEQMWQIATARTLAYRKTTELVHTQLVRKGRAEFFDTKNLGKGTFDSDWSHLLDTNYRGEIFDHPLYGKVYTTGRYDIKSPSKNPYNRDSKDDLGLNQYFVGQSPYEPYQGDPGDNDGIYHDKSEIIGPVRLINGCDKYSGETLAKGNGLEFPFKMYEVLKDDKGTDIKTGYEVEVIAKLKTESRTVVTKSYIDSGEHQSHEVVPQRAEVYYTVYALSDGGLLFCGSDPDVVWRASNDPMGNGGVDTSYMGYERLTFYAEGELKDQPTKLKKFVEQWDKFHGLEVKEDQQDWVGIAEIVLGIIGIAGFVLAPVLAPIMGFATTGWGFALGVASVMMGAASLGLAMFDPQASKLLGLGSAITGLISSITNLVSNITANTATNVANASASTLSAAGTAGKMGMSQTSSLYLGTGAMNASGVGASSATSMSFGELLKAGNMSFGEAINTSITGIESSLEASLWSSTMDVLKNSYKVYSDAKDVFKGSNDFSDDEIPRNDDKEAKTPIAMRFNGSLNSIIGYSKEGASDIGLMEGSLLFLNKPDFSLFNARLDEIEPSKKIEAIYTNAINKEQNEYNEYEIASSLLEKSKLVPIIKPYNHFKKYIKRRKIESRIKKNF